MQYSFLAKIVLGGWVVWGGVDGEWGKGGGGATRHGGTAGCRLGEESGDVHAAGAHVHAELVWRRLAPIAPHRRAWPKVRQRVSARRSQVDHASHPFQGRKGIAGCQHGDLRHKVSVHDFETDSWGHLGASAFSRASSETTASIVHTKPMHEKNL